MWSPIFDRVAPFGLGFLKQNVKSNEKHEIFNNPWQSPK